MAIPALHDGTWDQASCVRLVFGTTRVHFTEFKTPDVEVKIKKIARVGESRESRRTPGFESTADFEGKMLLTDYKSEILPNAGQHGFTLFHFVIIASVSHPSIDGSYDQMIDNCRIVKHMGLEFKGGSEDAMYKGIGISGGSVYERVSRGVWKCLAYRNDKPSALAQVLQEF
jgi:hypothetical protein